MIFESEGIKVETMFEGLHWVFTNKIGDKLSVICHAGSYGRELGQFEILPSWRKPQRYDSVKGWLSFGDVQKWINELKKRESSNER